MKGAHLSGWVASKKKSRRDEAAGTPPTQNREENDLRNGLAGLVDGNRMIARKPLGGLPRRGRGKREAINQSKGKNYGPTPSLKEGGQKKGDVRLGGEDSETYSPSREDLRCHAEVRPSQN